MCSDMQVHKHSRLLTFSCDVPFKLGKITLMIRGREHKSSMSLSEMNTSSFSEYLMKSCYQCFIWLYMQNDMVHWYFITEGMYASYCASRISRQLVVPTLFTLLLNMNHSVVFKMFSLHRYDAEKRKKKERKKKVVLYIYSLSWPKGTPKF